MEYGNFFVQDEEYEVQNEIAGCISSQLGGSKGF